MIFVNSSSDSGTISYRDSKRYLWLLSLLWPAISGLSALMLLSGGHVAWSAFPLFYGFVLVPLLDLLAGEDTSNPAESVIAALSADNYYRVLLFLSIPIFYGSFFLTAYAIATLNLPIWAFVLLAITAGFGSGIGITVGHELGHKQSRLDRLGGKIILALTGYAHFSIEHNKGHHVMVATPQDPVSARYGENVYKFAMREIPGAAIRGWRLEYQRLERKGHSVWSIHNDLLQGYAITAAIAVGLLAAFGWIMVPFLLLHHYHGWIMLTFANYVEHYGLLREKKKNGRYAPCEPRHSWNTNHLVSNLMLFHLQRHSDHHSNPMRPYQSLRDFEELPRLPSGYPGCYMMAMIPPVWFHIMNPRALAWADGDIAKLNTGPAN